MKLLSFNIRCAQGQRNPPAQQPVEAAEGAHRSPAEKRRRLQDALRAVAVLRAQASGDILSVAAAAGPDVQAALGMQMLEEFNRNGDAESIDAYLSEASRLHKATRDYYLGMNEAAMAMLRLVVGDDHTRTEDLLHDVEDLLRRTLVASNRDGDAPLGGPGRGRMQMSLRVVAAPAGSGAVLVARSHQLPAMTAGGDLDALCGGCAHVVAEGLVSATDIRGLVFFCPQCGRCSELPTG